MFLLKIKPWKSSKWTPPKGEDLITADKLQLGGDAGNMSKNREIGVGEADQLETGKA